MQSRSLQHVSVWLDDSAADDRIFPHALEWAFRLNLPLQAVITSQRFANQGMRGNSAKDVDRLPGAVVDRMKTWSAACAERGVVLEIFLSADGGVVAFNQFARPHGLCVFLENAASPPQEELLRRSARNRDIALLTCPATCTPVTRILLVQHQPKSDSPYLESAAGICRALDVRPVILIVADTEREANLRQGFAQAICNSFRLKADFDFVIGCDLPLAVRRVASWRSCSHVIIERQPASSWWQFANGNLLDQLRGRSGSLSVLALPESLTFDPPQKIVGKEMDSALGCAEFQRKPNKEYA